MLLNHQELSKWRVSFHLFAHRNRHGRPRSSELSWRRDAGGLKEIPTSQCNLGGETSSLYFMFNFCLKGWGIKCQQKTPSPRTVNSNGDNFESNKTTTGGGIFRSQPYGMMTVGCIVSRLFRWKLKLRSESISEIVNETHPKQIWQVTYKMTFSFLSNSNHKHFKKHLELRYRQHRLETQSAGECFQAAGLTDPMWYLVHWTFRTASWPASLAKAVGYRSGSWDEPVSRVGCYDIMRW